MAISLINLQGYEAPGDNHRKPLSPGLSQPQTCPLGQEQRRVQKAPQPQFPDLFRTQTRDALTNAASTNRFPGGSRNASAQCSSYGAHVLVQ